MSNGVLPPLLVLSVEREKIHYELVNLAEGAHLARRLLDGHGDERDVRVRGFGVGVASAVRLVPGAVQGVGAVHRHDVGVHLAASHPVHLGHGAHAGHPVHGHITHVVHGPH